MMNPEQAKKRILRNSRASIDREAMAAVLGRGKARDFFSWEVDMFKTFKHMRPFVCYSFNKDDPDFYRVAEEINIDYHNGDCEYVGEMADLRDLPLTNLYYVVDLNDAVVVIVPVGNRYQPGWARSSVGHTASLLINA